LIKCLPIEAYTSEASELAIEERCYLGADFTFLAAGVEGCLLSHGTAGLAVHVHVIKEDELCPGALAGFNGIAHETQPNLLPDLVIVLETNERVDSLLEVKRENRLRA
jgi:hypothetical protein